MSVQLLCAIIIQEFLRAPGYDNYIPSGYTKRINNIIMIRRMIIMLPYQQLR